MSYKVWDYLGWSSEVEKRADDTNTVHYLASLYGALKGETLEIRFIADIVDKEMLDVHIGGFFVKAYLSDKIARRGVYIQAGLQDQGYGEDSSIAVIRLIAQNAIRKRREWFEDKGVTVVPDDGNWLNMKRDNLAAVFHEGHVSEYHMGILQLMMEVE